MIKEKKQKVFISLSALFKNAKLKNEYFDKIRKGEVELVILTENSEPLLLTKFDV